MAANRDAAATRIHQIGTVAQNMPWLPRCRYREVTLYPIEPLPKKSYLTQHDEPRRPIHGRMVGWRDVGLVHRRCHCPRSHSRRDRPPAEEIELGKTAFLGDEFTNENPCAKKLNPGPAKSHLLAMSMSPRLKRFTPARCIQRCGRTIQVTAPSVACRLSSKRKRWAQVERRRTKFATCRGVSG